MQWFHMKIAVFISFIACGTNMLFFAFHTLTISTNLQVETYQATAPPPPYTLSRELSEPQDWTQHHVDDGGDQKFHGFIIFHCSYS